MPQVYEEPISRRHYAGRVSAAYCLPKFTFLMFIVVSCALAFSTGNLWIKSHSFHVQPDVHFTYETLVVFESTVPGEEKVWSSLDSVAGILQETEKLAPVDIQAAEQDLNMDGKVDLIDIKIKTPTTPVHSVKLLLGFQYEIKARVDLKMRSMAYVHYSSPAPGSSLHVDGELRLQQLEPLTASTSNKDYEGTAGSPFTLISTSVEDPQDLAMGANKLAHLKLSGMMNQYLFRNESTYYDYKFPIWQPGSSGQFELNARIRIPSHETVIYQPGGLETFKFGWIQIMCFLLPLWYLWRIVEHITFHYRILRTRVVSDLTPKTHRF